jgi:hypothetical protein
MNTPFPFSCRRRPGALRRLALAGVFCGLLVSISFGEGEHRMYTLFEGADILIGQGGALHSVRDISGGAWVVSEKGQPVAISASAGPVSMKINPLQKLSDVSVTMADLKVEGSYTLANDPEVKLTRSLAEAASLNAGDAAAANQANAGTIVTMSGNNSGNVPNGGHTNLGPATQTPVATTNENDEIAYQGWDGSAGFDLLNVAFKVSSAKPLADPYIVVITKFHPPGSEAGSFRNLIYAKALNPISAQAQEIKFVQSGFPPGFQLLRVEIHLYDRGQEFATSLSQNRREMTLPEAFEYTRDAYLRTHKTDTLPATPVMVDILPADFKEKLAQGLYSGVVYVKVSKSGVGEDAYSDPECSKRIDDPYLDSVVKCIRFEPALENGKAIEGSSALNLSRLRA